MERKCCVKNCGIALLLNHIDKKFYKLPRDSKLRSKWLKNCGIVDNSTSSASSNSTQSTPGLYVCWRHFRRSDYEFDGEQKGLLLKKEAVPTIFQDYEKHPDPLIMPVKSLNINYPQEDLDLIKSKTLPQLLHLDSPNDNSGESSNPSKPQSSVDFLHPSDSQEENQREIADQRKKPKKIETKMAPPAEPPPAARQVPVLSEVQNQASMENVQKDGSKASKVVARGDLKFFPGARLEAKDFNEQWYIARVVETDWCEREVLVHFDKWNSRFDEWIPMDSSRLRELQTQSSILKSEQDWIIAAPDPKPRDFEIGERILATWADGRKYPAKVNAVLGNDRYDVLFDDGYSKVVRSSKMTKIAGTSEKAGTSSQQELQMDTEPYIGSKQERRDKNRKHTVTELFHLRKRSRVEEKSKKEEVSEDHESEIVDMSEASGSNDGEGLRGFPSVKKGKNNNKRKREHSKFETDEDDVGPEWVDGEPQGIVSFTTDGMRRSIIVPDKRLPSGWQKHFVQRKTGSSAGKWDVVFVHTLTEKKFRSRSDLKTFFEAQGQPNFNTDVFDFCIHRRKKAGAAKSHAAKAENTEVPRKIKTLLPKAKASNCTASENLLSPANSPYAQSAHGTTSGGAGTSGDDGAVFIGGLRVEMEDSAYKCPIEGCTKTFRKENLLQMHIKHYHKEYSQFVGSTPNVADLAYARTIGEFIQDVPSKKSSEKRKSLQISQTMSPLTASDTSVTDHGSGHDSKPEMMSPMSSNSMDVIDEGGHRVEAGAMSPGSLFDLKLKEEKTQGGIKTLLPVRPATDSKIDRLKALDETGHFDKVKGQRRRKISEYSSDTSSIKGKKLKGSHDITEDYGDLDDSALDAEGPTELIYRYSRRKSDAKSDDNSQSNSEGVMMMINGELVKVEQLKREEIINCTCGITEEDGLMIQCDLCLCWQHGHCNSIERERDVPEKYVCYICRNPFRGRSSKKYIHNQDWIKEGKLETLGMRNRSQEVLNQRTAMLKRSYDLVAALLELQQILHSLRVKINVAQKKDHPKLYLWAKDWAKSKIPQPQLNPIPVLEIISSGDEHDDITEESKMKSEDVDEAVSKNEGKLIASDSELMKILEEDSSVINEGKTDEDKNQILLSALMKSEEVKDKEQEEKPTVPLEEPVKPLQPIIPEPEAPIDLDECRLRLLEHIEHFQDHVDSRLATVEAHLCALEAMESSREPLSEEVFLRIKQTIQMLSRDLTTIRKLAALY